MARKPKSKAPSVEQAVDAASGPDSDAATQEQAQATETATQPADASRPASDTPPATKTQAHEQAADAAGTTPHATGNVPDPSTSSEAAEPQARVRYHEIRERLMKHAEWGQIIGTVKEMRLDPKLAKMRAEHRERFIWSELDRLYPPKPEPSAPHVGTTPPRSEGETPLGRKDESPQVGRGSERITGLGDIPPNWPQLPAGASLTAEVGWVQAERLRIVEERPGGATVVSLALARAPAPSWAALSWLETSIRSYAKFVEVAAKVASAPDDEQAQAKRERMGIDEIRSLLAEMVG